MTASDHHYNVALLFKEVAAANAPEAALRYDEQTHSYAELSRWVESLAAFLIAQGCRQGDVIAIGHNKRPLSYALMLAALRIGAPYANIDVASPATRTSTILQVTRASLLFYDDREYATAMESLAASRTSCSPPARPASRRVSQSPTRTFFISSPGDESASTLRARTTSRT
jgi:D-alanine--poly(phosphoribitol) ligase subunit 1